MTDKQLRWEVEQELEFEPEVDATAIGVSAENGVVRLTGYVQTLGEKLAAERAARRVYSAKAVVDDLEVRLESRDSRTDSEIAEDAVRLVESLASIPPDSVRLVVRDGHLILNGEVDWKYQSANVENAVRHVRGVKGVTSHLQVRPRDSAVDVAGSIRDALHRYADVDARAIEVEDSGARVVLKGVVRSHLEREVAVEAAWRGFGVLDVDDQLRIEPEVAE